MQQDMYMLARTKCHAYRRRVKVYVRHACIKDGQLIDAHMQQGMKCGPHEGEGM